MIKSIDYLGKTRVLVDSETKKPIVAGSTVQDFRGNDVVVIGGRAPHKAGSTGRVTVEENDLLGGTREFYPSVVGAKWV